MPHGGRIYKFRPLSSGFREKKAWNSWDATKAYKEIDGFKCIIRKEEINEASLRLISILSN